MGYLTDLLYYRSVGALNESSEILTLLKILLVYWLTIRDESGTNLDALDS